MRALMARGQGDPLVEIARTTADTFVGRQIDAGAAGMPALTRLSGLVLTRAVFGAIGAAVFGEIAAMKTAPFKD